VVDKSATVVVIGQRRLKPLAPARLLRQQMNGRRSAVMAVGGMDVVGEHAALHVGDDLALAPINVLAAGNCPVNGLFQVRRRSK
jgi:hypothetical protein